MCRLTKGKRLGARFLATTCGEQVSLRCARYLLDGAAVELGVPDPFTRKTYLHAVDDPVLPVRFSLGKRVRALQFQAFFKGLETTAEGFMGRADGLELVVLTPSDWRRQLSAPYGWGLTRRSETGVSVALPAGYPPRLIAKWDAVRLRAGRAGVRAPGSVPAFLDALLGLEWAHARLLLTLPGKRPKAWLRELGACYLYQRVLRDQGDTYMLETLDAWARLEHAGGAEPVSENAAQDELEPLGPNSLGADWDDTAPPASPRDFLYPRSRMTLPTLLVAQGALWLEAAVLAEQEGRELSPEDVQRVAKATLKNRAVPL